MSLMLQTNGVFMLWRHVKFKSSSISSAAMSFCLIILSVRIYRSLEADFEGKFLSSFVVKFMVMTLLVLIRSLEFTNASLRYIRSWLMWLLCD